MMESICSNTVFAAWEAINTSVFAMWKDLAALGWAMFVVLMIFLLINIALTAYVLFAPNKRGREQ